MLVVDAVKEAIRGAHLLRGASRSVLKVHRVPLLAITPYDALKSSISFTTGSGVVLFILHESHSAP